MLAPTSEGQIRANRPFARQGGVTPPYGAIENRCTVGAGHAPPATVYYNEYNGLVCRGGIYAARATIRAMHPTG